MSAAAATATTPEFQTFVGVELAHVGMEWQSAVGPCTLTMQHLADMVAAENDDPHILSPRLKIGHDDPRFNEEPRVADPFAYHGPLRDDGNPVYGKVVNLRLAEDGMVIVGDYVEVPAWLGDALPSAYPSRSFEGDWDVETQGGKHYSLVMTAVALLGEPMPAITCLDDLVRELTGGPAAVTAKAPVTLKGEAMPVAASASIDAVREQFFDEFAKDNYFWWWPIDILVDDAKVLADDDEGHLYQIPITVDADGNVTWGTPVRGVLDFRAVPDTEPVAASRKPMFASAEAAGRPKDRVRPVAATVDQGGTMNDEQKALAVKLGLGEGATVEQLNEKLQADALAAETADPKPDPEPEPEPETEPVDEREPVAATVTVSEEVWKQTNTRLSTLEERDNAREVEATKTRRDGIAAAAIQDGRIMASEHDHYRSMLEVDEEKTSKLLASLAKGRVPITERGSAPAAASAATDLGWFPQFDRQKETVNG